LGKALKFVFPRLIGPKGGKIYVPLTGAGVIELLNELKGI
jgi:hypothetical protein